MATTNTEHVWPGASSAGFACHGRSAWRDLEDRVDVITFWAIGSYNAEVLRTTPHSFKIQLGIWLKCATEIGGQEATNDGEPRPSEAQCPFRRSLPSRAQTVPSDEALWHVDHEDDLKTIARQACEAIEDEALPWFERFADRREILRTLENDSEDMRGTWGFGNEGSPNRKALIKAVRAKP